MANMKLQPSFRTVSVWMTFSDLKALSLHLAVSYNRMLLHDTMLKVDSYHTGTSVSAVCECGTEPESVEHFLIQCPLHEEARNRMTKNIKEIWNTSNSKTDNRIYTSILNTLHQLCRRNVINFHRTKNGGHVESRAAIGRKNMPHHSYTSEVKEVPACVCKYCFNALNFRKICLLAWKNI